MTVVSVCLGSRHIIVGVVVGRPGLMGESWHC